MNARPTTIVSRLGGLSAIALGLLLLAELALAAFRFFFLTYKPAGLQEDAPDDLLIFVFHVLFALTLVTLYAALNRRVRLLGQLGLMMALVGTMLFAAFGFFPVTVQEQFPPGGNFWPGVGGGIGPLLFGNGLALFGLTASEDRTVGRNTWLRMGAVITLASSVMLVLWLLALTLFYGEYLTASLYWLVLSLLVLLFPAGIVFMGIGFTWLGWFLLRVSDARSRGSTESV